jgi:hypothetical protein
MSGSLPVVAIGLSFLALNSEAASDDATAKPGLPQVLTFQLEDGGHRTSGLALSFALPGVIEYECQRIAFHTEIRNREIEIVLLNVEPVENLEGCRMAKVPAPVRERILLPPEIGNYRIVFARRERRDTYALAVTEGTVALEAVGSPTFTTCAETGKLMRVGLNWLWVDFLFVTDDSSRRMRTKRDEVLSALEAIGAKTFAPPPGRYLLDGFVRQIPSGPSSDRDAMEERFFLWEGDWERLRLLASRYQKHAAVATRRPVMILWLSGRDNVVSTSGGYLHSSAIERKRVEEVLKSPPSKPHSSGGEE